ncbi:MAG: hypothetical protein LBO63_00135, partial [Oscillospiraceae bacterium]|nr:hypothetical protein [Oscillospiraceae bacterium]
MYGKAKSKRFAMTRRLAAAVVAAALFFAVFTVAAIAETLPFGQPLNVTVPVSGGTEFGFFPSETGIYRLTIAEPAGALAYVRTSVFELTDGGSVLTASPVPIYPQLASVGYDHRDFSLTGGASYVFLLEPSVVGKLPPNPETVELSLTIQLV